MSVRTDSGSCFCGAIAAEMHGDPFWICFDHDEDCRRAIGAAVVVWAGYRPEQVRFTQGVPKTYSKTKGVVRAFCANCGTSITYFDEGISTELYVALGFLHHPERFRPQAHAYWIERLLWIDFDDELPRIEGYSRIRDPIFGTPNRRK